MAKQPGPGILALLLIVSIAAGRVVGFFIGRSQGGSADISEEGQKQYACEIVRDLDERFPTAESWEEADPNVFGEVASASYLFGGYMPMEGDPTEEALGRELLVATQRLDLEQLDRAIDDLVGWCG